MIRRSLLAGAAVLLTACGDRGPGAGRQTEQAISMAQAAAEPEELTYAPSLDIAIDRMRRLPSGVLIHDLRVGGGDSAHDGRIAEVRYTGWLVDGTPFDSNRHGAPFTFRVGAGEVIEGWDEGVVGMRVGGRRQLVIPPRMGYGEWGMGPIPPYATLVFEVELVGLQ
jgi:FKBP-type peptidyl-prolyl cis-trans isomerase FkpA